MKNKRQTTKGIEKKFEVIRVFAAVFIALVIAFVLISVVSSSPAEALRQFLIGPLMSGRNLGNVIELTIPLIFSGLAVCVMFQCNQFNMGAEGAFFFGGGLCSCNLYSSGWNPSCGCNFCRRGSGNGYLLNSGFIEGKVGR